MSHEEWSTILRRNRRADIGLLALAGLAVLALAVGVFVLIGNLGAQDVQPEDSPTEQLAGSQDDSSSTPNLNGNGDPVPPLHRDLRRAGVTVTDVQMLASITQLHGYGLGKQTSLNWSQSQDMAFVALYVCERVYEGGRTWREQIAEDISTGAPPSDAQAFNGLLA